MANPKPAQCPQHTAAFLASFGGLAMGTFIGWSVPAQEKLYEYNFEVVGAEYMWVYSAPFIGAAIVCIPTGILINIIGRKGSMLCLTIPFIVAWLLIVFAKSVTILNIGQFFGGVAGGAFSVAGPIYTAEISDPKIRGTNGFMFQLNITLGILFVVIVGGIFTIFKFSLLCMIIPIVFPIFFMFMPESPLFLLHKGKQDDAQKAMLFLRGKNYSSTDELAGMQAEMAKYPSLNPLQNINGFKRKATKRGLLVCLGLMFFQQFCGINVVLFFSAEIFGEATNGEMDEKYSNMFLAGVQAIAAIVATIIVDKVGRRFLLLVSDFIMALCTIALGLYYYLDRNSPSTIENKAWITAIIVCLFMVMYSFGFGPIPWLMVGELFAPDVRGICGSLGGAFNWLLGFFISTSFKYLKDALGQAWIFWIFSVASLIGTALVFFFVPETKGLSLNEIQDKLEKSEI